MRITKRIEEDTLTQNQKATNTFIDQHKKIRENVPPYQLYLFRNISQKNANIAKSSSSILLLIV